MSATRELKKTSIFSGDFDLSQLMHHIDPADIRPIYDRVLVKEIPESEVHGSLVLPESAVNRQKDAGLRIGLVVAVGKGDKWIERGWSQQKEAPTRKSIKGVCDFCRGAGEYELTSGPEFESVKPKRIEKCCECHGDGSPRLSMEVKPGDRVVFNRHRNTEIYIGESRYSLIYESQAIWAILDGETAA